MLGTIKLRCVICGTTVEGDAVSAYILLVSGRDPICGEPSPGHPFSHCVAWLWLLTQQGWFDVADRPLDRH